ncbi:MAG: sigma-54 dependent transcriptional regulator [Spirochaetales bacterium]|nr:sigma-54 dependent transcriptional regulator [Spirochaetales bacterium]
MKSILIIDDEIGICQSLSFGLQFDYDVSFTTDPDEGLDIIKEKGADIVLLDLRIGRINGLEVLAKIKTVSPETIVIILTAYSSDETTTEAMKLGAYTYLSKAVSIDDLMIFLEQALEFRSLNEKVSSLTDELKSLSSRFEMIGESESMQKIFQLIEKLKDVDTRVMVTGESGTGKELVARAIHFSGKRKDKHFVAVNCAAIPEYLLESELFGHKSGAFTGATENKLGKFALADGGTLFLDEIGEMPVSIQSKILRVIQEKEFSPVGSNVVEKVDVRIIAATNRNLRKMVTNGDFREDLFYRLNVVEVRTPPLRERKSDLHLFCQYYVKKFNEEQKKQIVGFSPSAWQLLLNYDYPGNVRQLGNIIEHAMILSSTEVIEIEALPYELRDDVEVKAGTLETEKIVDNYLGAHTLEEIEEKAIKAALKKYDNKKQAAANHLGISERTLWNKLKKYN